MKSLLLFLCYFLGVFGFTARFDNYQVRRLLPANRKQIQVLRELEVSGEYDFWTLSGAVNRSSDVLVPPHKRAHFEEFVYSNNISQSCLIDDVQRLIDEEEGRAAFRCRDMDWTSYHGLDEIYDWMADVAKKYPFVQRVVAGKSYEGRRIEGLEISFSNSENTTGVFIESGMHGREWIVPAATTWMVKQIIDSPANSVFRNFSYYYFPVVNPDGYYYSWTHNRLWKKTRTPYKVGALTCYGADPNRNWDYRWNEIRGCNNPCSENFAGKSPFSEVEMRSVASYLKGIARSRYVDIYMAYRSYSQLVLYPWDNDATPAPQRDLWQRIGEAAAEELKGIHGTEYDVGNSCEFFYPISGVSRNWYYGLYNSTISYMFELKDKGSKAFFIPADEIIPSGEELMAALGRILLEYQKLNVTNLALVS